MRRKQVEFAFDGEPYEVFLMRKRGWRPSDFALVSNRVLQEMLAADRLEAERSSRQH